MDPNGAVGCQSGCRGCPVCYSINGKLLWTADTRTAVQCLALTPDGRYAVVGGPSKVRRHGGTAQTLARPRLIVPPGCIVAAA